MATTPKKPKTEKDPNAVPETKSAKFQRLGAVRMTKAIKSISLIGNLSSRSNYEYTPENVSAMQKALSDAVSAVLSRFSASAPVATDEGFKF